jgi:hypothetical protein
MAKLDRLQTDIDQTRARLAANLKVLTQKDTVGELQQTFLSEAAAKKDEVIALAKATGRDFVQDLASSFKTKVAENPAAALAIGAGIGWKLWKDPPIASLLVGLGLYSLFTGTTRTTLITEQITEKLGQAGETLVEGFEAGKGTLARATTRTRDMTAAAWESTREVVEEQMDDLARRQLDTRNAALLGAAGVAVAAAIGLAVQKYREDS